MVLRFFATFLIVSVGAHDTVEMVQTKVSGDATAQPCDLVGCPDGLITSNNVCGNYANADSRTHDWEACPYQMPGNWRWKPTFNSEGVATQCLPPPEQEKGYNTDDRYQRKDWQKCNGQRHEGQVTWTWQTPTAQPCSLEGCPDGVVDGNNVCGKFKTKELRAAANAADWAACPYQMPGNWRWKPTFDAAGDATQCLPPYHGEKGYETDMHYKSQDWQKCERQGGQASWSWEWVATLR